MGLLDTSSEEPRSKLRRHVITIVVLVLLLAGGLWYVFRFHTERRTVERFLDTVIAGDAQQAYRLWHPQASYAYSDFLQDWGPSGYYGPVKSYHIESIEEPRNASGVIVVVEVSPDQPFPSGEDVEKNRHIKEVHIWVERSDQSLSFPP